MKTRSSLDIADTVILSEDTMLAPAPAAAVPEPGIGALLLSVASLLARRRRATCVRGATLAPGSP